MCCTHLVCGWHACGSSVCPCLVIFSVCETQSWVLVLNMRMLALYYYLIKRIILFWCWQRSKHGIGDHFALASTDKHWILQDHLRESGATGPNIATALDTGIRYPSGMPKVYTIHPEESGIVRARAFKPPLQTIILSNVRALRNKIDELHAATQRLFE